MCKTIRLNLLLIPCKQENKNKLNTLISEIIREIEVGGTLHDFETKYNFKDKTPLTNQVEAKLKIGLYLTKKLLYLEGNSDHETRTAHRFGETVHQYSCDKGLISNIM